MGKSWLLTITLSLGLFLVGCVSVGVDASTDTENNLILNPGFLGLDGLVPIDWTVFGGTIGVQLHFIDGEDMTGDKVFMIDDSSAENGYGLRSHLVPVESGATYHASVTARTGEGGSATLYLDFWDANLKRIVARTAHVKDTEWETISVSLEAPDDAVLVTIILYSSITTVGQSYFKNPTLSNVGASF